jgi:hypothetical protein
VYRYDKDNSSASNPEIDIAAVEGMIIQNEEELVKLEERLEQFRESSPSFEDVRGITPDLYSIQARIEAIKLSLMSLKEQKPRYPVEPFEIRASLEDYDGPPLSGPVQNGDIIAFQADIQFPACEPASSSLIWQIYDASGSQIPGLTRQERLYEADTIRNFRFRIQLEEMEDGEYAVGLFHSYSDNPDQQTSARYLFRVTQTIRIDRILVTDDPERQEHSPIISPDKDPLLYAYYSLGKGVDSATIALSAIEKNTGNIIDTVSVERPRPGETAPFRVGLRIPANIMPAETEIIAEARITTSDGRQHSAEIPFKKEQYGLVLNIPNSVKSGENRPFSISVPQNFKEPFTVDINATGKGFSLGHVPGSLEGTIGGIATGASELGNITVTVTDVEGRKATAHSGVLIEPSDKAIQTASPAGQVSADVTPVQSTVRVKKHDMVTSDSKKLPAACIACTEYFIYLWPPYDDEEKINLDGDWDANFWGQDSLPDITNENGYENCECSWNPAPDNGRLGLVEVSISGHNFYMRREAAQDLEKALTNPDIEYYFERYDNYEYIRLDRRQIENNKYRMPDTVIYKGKLSGISISIGNRIITSVRAASRETGRERWTKIADEILSYIIPHDISAQHPQVFQNIRQEFLAMNSEDYQKLGRMSKPELTDYTEKTTKQLAETLYNQFMGADHNPILEKLIRHMYTNSLISQTQMEAYTRKEVRNRRR